MKVLIVGAGETGYYIASEFTSDNYEVSVIDENPTNLAKVQKNLNAAGFSGNGTSLSVLESAGIEETDLFIACTDHDETNLISCLLANQYDVKQKIAVTKTRAFQKKDVIESYQRTGIDMVINSSLVVAEEILAVSNLEIATEVASFAEKNVLLVGYKVKKDSPLANKMLKELVQPTDQGKFLIACIVREEESIIPSGNDIISPGDYVYLMISKRECQILNEFLDIKISKSRKAVVSGDCLIAESIVSGLLKEHFSVTLICNQQEDTQKIKKKFSRENFHAVCGDAAEVKLQLQLDVPLSSLFISVHRDDNINIAAGMVAHYLGAKKVITQINRQDFLQISDAAGIDVMISPRLVTARRIKKIIRGGEDSLDFTTISETDMEVIEMVAHESSQTLGVHLKDLKLPKGVLVGAIVNKHKKVIIPTGESMIEKGDKVIILTMPETLDKITMMIEGEVRQSPLNPT